MSNLRKPLLGYTVIIATIIGILVFGYNTLFPKQYTEIEFGMNQEDLIKLKGEPDEGVIDDNKIYVRLEYKNDEYLGYKCESWFEFSRSFYNKNKYDKLSSYGYRYSSTNEDVDSNKKMFSDLRNKLIKIYGKELYIDNYLSFNKIYNEDETVFSSWEYKNGEAWLFCSKENGIRIMYKKQ